MTLRIVLCTRRLFFPSEPVTNQQIAKSVTRPLKKDFFLLALKSPECRLRTYLLNGVGSVGVALEEVEHALSEDLEGEANVSVIVECVEHSHAKMAAMRVFSIQLTQYVDL